MNFLTQRQQSIINYTIKFPSPHELDLLDIISRQQKCIDLMLYYVNSDSTWEALQDRCKKIMEGVG